MNRIECFWLEPTDQVDVRLRRFTFSGAAQCSAHAYGHNSAAAVIGRWSDSEHVARTGREIVFGDVWPHDDPRWPKVCVCGYEFAVEDEWQCRPETLYRRAETGELFTRHTMPGGAMFNAKWNVDVPEWCGPDGKSLVMKLPDGCEWMIDAPARDGGKWTRSGDAPRITVRPSILTPGYHGWLTNGVLEAC